MKNLFVYLSAIILITSCSSDDGDAPVPINTIESQIVGKTFWRVLEGSSCMQPYSFVPHYFGIEFNEDGNIYRRYCADSLYTWFEDFDTSYSRIYHDNAIIAKYELIDDIVRIELPSDWYDEEDYKTMNLLLSTYLNSLSGSEYLAFNYIIDRIGLNPDESTFDDLNRSFKIDYIDTDSLSIFYSQWLYFASDCNSKVTVFDEFVGWSNTWSSDPPNCNDYPIYQ